MGVPSAIVEDPEKLKRELYYRQLYVSPVTEEEKLKFVQEARKIEVQLQLTRKHIAEELEISLEHIAFVPQTKFHLDMELFVTPNGEIALHDEQTTLDFLNSLQLNNKLNQEETNLFNEYKRTATLRSHTFKAIQSTRLDRLNQLSVRIHLLPAVLEAPDKNALNFCNGIFAKNGRHIVAILDGERCFGRMREKGFTFVTTGPTDDAEWVFYKQFSEIFKRTFPELILVGIPNMSEFVAKYHGGVHCLTFERSLS